jgi:hypothetical protein
MGFSKDEIAKRIQNGKNIGGARYPYIDNAETAVMGDYIVELETFKKKVGEVDKHDKFIAELVVVESPDAAKLQNGSRLQWIRTPAAAKFPDTSWNEVYNLMQAATGLEDLSSLTGDEIEESYGPSNPLKGRRMKARVFKKPSGFVAVRFFAAE